MNYIINRLKERSTWLGVITVITALGVSLSPQLAEAIATAGASLAGIIAILTADRK